MRVFYTTQILTSMTVLIECISWLIKVTNNNDARWKPEITKELCSQILKYEGPKEDMNDDEAEDAKEGFSEMETQEEEKLLVRGGSVKKPDSPEKQGMFLMEFEAQEEIPT